MRFLCFSFLSPPATDAESACTGRFLSALAAAGHKVKLITLDYYEQESRLPDDVVAQLLDSRIEIVRMPLKHYGMVRRFLSKMRYGLFGICTEYIKESVRVVRNDLKENPDTVLITRSAWPASNIVGWYCRRYAKKWIPHFSDPFPSYKKMTPKDWWRYPFAYFWLWRILRDSFSVTVTCHNAIRYFNAITFGRYRNKFYVTYHVGFPRLATCGYSVPRVGDEKVIVHVGAVMPGRPVERFARCVCSAKGVRLVQYGSVGDSSVRKMLDPQPITSPAMATDAMASSDAILVADLDSGFGYTPYLPSKFAYAAALGKPIVCLTTKDSEMALWAKKVSGVYLVDVVDLEKNAMQIVELLENNNLVPVLQKDAADFTPEAIADSFADTIS